MGSEAPPLQKSARVGLPPVQGSRPVRPRVVVGGDGGIANEQPELLEERLSLRLEPEAGLQEGLGLAGAADAIERLGAMLQRLAAHGGGGPFQPMSHLGGAGAIARAHAIVEHGQLG